MLIDMPQDREAFVQSGLAVRIDLTQGQFTIVDIEVLPLVSGKRWFAARARDSFYAHHTGYSCGKNVTIRMHRLIIGAPPDLHVDHINGDSLDNRASNLRVCTISQNARNATKRAAAKSRYKGVSLSNTGNRWVANIYHGGKLHFVGSFLTEIDAAKAYDAQAISRFGQFARPNFPGDV